MANSRFEILVNINGEQQELDTFGVESMSVNYVIADINDLQNRQSSYSKTIELPETSHNRKVFKQVSDLGSDSQFNPNLKTQCWVLVDSITVFEGYLQLNYITPNLDSGQTKYQVTIFSNSSDFFTNVGEKYLQDIDFSDLDHNWTYEEISNSWNTNYGNGFYYPMIDYGNNWTINSINNSTGTYSSEARVIDFYPATYIKFIFDRIFREAGYYYQSNFLNGDTFSNLLLPFGKTIMSNTLDFRDDLIFRAGIPNEIDTSRNFSDFYNSVFYYYFPIPFSDTTTPPDGDPNGVWDTSTYVYTNLSPSPYQQRFGLSLAAAGRLQNPFDGGNKAVESLIILGVRSMDPNTGVTVSNWDLNPSLTDLFSYYRIPFQNAYDWYDLFEADNNQTSIGFAESVGTSVTNFSSLQTSGLDSPYGILGVNKYVYGYTDYLDGRPDVIPINSAFTMSYHPLYQGEEVRFYIIKSTTFGYSGATLSTIAFTQSSYIFNDVNQQAIPGQPIDYNTILPLNYKQKDFLTDIFKMFNLYVEPNKNVNNTLIIEPRDDYYATGNILDWSRKIDISQDIQEQILAETQNKSTLFTYRSDSDYYNTDYTGKTSEIDGQLRYEVENDFLSDENKIDCSFSPTPLTILPGSKDIVLPVIFKVNNNQVQKTTSNPRILRRSSSGLVELSPLDTWFILDENNNLFTQSSYPYIGNFNDPYNPTEDLNWGQSYLYYQNVPTNNNLVSNYWLNQLNEISDKNSRIITCEMYLSPNDIQQFYFSDIIFLNIDTNGQYYRVNSISNYDPSNPDSTCTVELIKALDTTIPKDSNAVKIYQVKSANVHFPGTGPQSQFQIGNVVPIQTGNNIFGIPNHVSGVYNNVSGNWNQVLGNNNNVISFNSQVSGSFNNMQSGYKSLIFGDNNGLYDSHNSMISGDHNLTIGSSSGLKIFGNNNTVAAISGITGASPSNYFLNEFIFGDYNTASSERLIIFGDNINSPDISTQSYQFILNMPMVLGPSGSLPGGTSSTGPTGPAGPTGSIAGLTGATGSPKQVSYYGADTYLTSDIGFVRDVTNQLLIASQSLGLTFSKMTLSATQSTFIYQDTTGLSNILSLTKDGPIWNGSTNPLYIEVTNDSFILLDQPFTPAVNSANLFIGKLGPLGFLSTAQFNVFISQSGAINLQSGTNNTVMGFGAGAFITSGSSNTLIGSGAGGALVSGFQNTVVGSGAGGSIQSGINNVIIGDGAAGSLDSNDNVIIGFEAGNNIVSGTNNVMIGNAAGSLNDVSGCVFVGDVAGELTSGNKNICIGSGGTDAVTFTNCIVIGNDGAQATANGQIVLASSTTPLTLDSGLRSPNGNYLIVVVNGVTNYLPLYS